jgi:hypothetical protein
MLCVHTCRARRSPGSKSRIDRVEQKFDAKFLLLQWMLGFNLVLTAGVLWRLIR